MYGLSPSQRFPPGRANHIADSRVPEVTSFSSSNPPTREEKGTGQRKDGNSNTPVYSSFSLVAVISLKHSFMNNFLFENSGTSWSPRPLAALFRIPYTDPRRKRGGGERGEDEGDAGQQSVTEYSAAGGGESQWRTLIFRISRFGSSIHTAVLIFARNLIRDYNRNESFK